MVKDWTSPEHVAKIGLSIMHVLAEEFHIEAKKPTGEKDHSLMVKLSQAVGYQSQLFSALQKSHEFARRLNAVEKSTQHITAEELALLHNPVVIAEKENETLKKMI
jgi:hypothetical protein